MLGGVGGRSRPGSSNTEGRVRGGPSAYLTNSLPLLYYQFEALNLTRYCFVERDQPGLGHRASRSASA